MVVLIAFLRVLLTYLAIMSEGKVIKALVPMIPTSMYSIKKSFSNTETKEYVVCMTCDMLYDVSECIIERNGQKQLILWLSLNVLIHLNNLNVTAIMKRNSVSGKSRLVPRKVFYYHSVISGLKIYFPGKDFFKTVNIGGLRQHLRMIKCIPTSMMGRCVKSYNKSVDCHV